MLKVPKEVAGQGLTYIIGAFGFVAALAWNEAIKALINKFFQADSNLVSLFVYALVITLIAVIATKRLANIQNRLKE